MTNGILIYGEKFAHFLIGSPSSYMSLTLHLIPSGFPYIWENFCFLFYQCIFSIKTVLQIHVVRTYQNTMMYVVQDTNVNMLVSYRSSVILCDKYVYIFAHPCTLHCTNEGPVRIQYKSLVLIYVFPEMKLCGLVTSKTEL